MTDLADLIARVEGASGRDRDIDADLWWLFGHQTALVCFNNASMGLPRQLPATLPIPAGLGRAAVRSFAEPFTASLDAALALVERVLPEWEFSLSTARHRKGWSVTTWQADDKYSGRLFDHKTAPLAILSALLKAVQAQSPRHNARDGSSQKDTSPPLHTGGGQSSPKPSSEPRK